MNTDEHRYFDALTERVLGAVFEVSNTLGAGEYFADILVEDVLVIELKLCRAPLPRTHRAMYQLFASIGPEPVSAGQFPETESRVEACRLWFSGAG